MMSLKRKEISVAAATREFPFLPFIRPSISSIGFTSCPAICAFLLVAQTQHICPFIFGRVFSRLVRWLAFQQIFFLSSFFAFSSTFLCSFSALLQKIFGNALATADQLSQTQFNCPKLPTLDIRKTHKGQNTKIKHRKITLICYKQFRIVQLGLGLS